METEAFATFKAFAEYGVLGLLVVGMGSLLWWLLRMYHKMMMGLIASLQGSLDKNTMMLDKNTTVLGKLAETCTRNSVMLGDVPRARPTEMRYRDTPSSATRIITDD